MSWYSHARDLSGLTEPVYRTLYNNPGLVWALLAACILFVWLVYPVIAQWLRDWADRKRLEDPLTAERIRVARLKQMDAYREAKKMAAYDESRKKA